MRNKPVPVGTITHGLKGSRYRAEIKEENRWRQLTKIQALDLGIPWPELTKNRADKPKSKHYSEKMPLIGSKSPEHTGKLAKLQGERVMRIKSTEGMRLIRVDSKTEIYAYDHETDSEIISRWEAKRKSAVKN